MMLFHYNAFKFDFSMDKIIMAVLVFSVGSVNSQDFNHGKAIAYNVVGSSLFSGLGSAINKKKDEKLGHAFLKGLWQGAIGGTVIYGSKNIIQGYADTGSPLYAWGSKLVNAAGTSITENAAANMDFWQRWHLNIGFARFEYNVNPKRDKRGFYFKVMPFALASTVVATQKGNFDFSKSIQTGNLVFSTKKGVEVGYLGMSYAGTLIYDSTIPDYLVNGIIAHEIIHLYQVDDFIYVNSYMDRLYKNSSFFSGKILDWVYLDINSLVTAGIYNLEGINNQCYYDNYFEWEANLFSEKLKCSK